MKINVVSKFLGFFSAVITICMLAPFIYAACTDEGDAYPFAFAVAVGIMTSCLLFIFGRSADLADIGMREAMMSVTMSWMIASAIGGMPYYLHGTAPTFADAFFEAMSGFTTTGATIIEDIDAVPRGLLLWRSITHWLGGMGIIVLTLTIMPIVGVGGFNLYVAEVPGLDNERMTPRVRQTAAILWLIYLAITAVLTIALAAFGMSFFDAITHAFGTISTGGFTPHNGSMGYFDDARFDWIITFFMYISGVNFALHFQALRGRSIKAFFKDAEFMFYTKMTLVFSAIVSVGLYFARVHESGWDCVRHGAFQVVSFITTSGFVSDNYDIWPPICRAILFLTFFAGACAGSTAGGIKQIRLLIFFHHAVRHIKLRLHPKAIMPIKVGDKAMAVRDVSSTLAFLGLYLIVFVLGTLAISFFEGDMLTAVSGTATTIGNVGPGFNMLGATSTFAQQAWGAKWIYSFLMLCGRLELFTVLVLFTGAYWSAGITTAGRGGRDR